MRRVLTGLMATGALLASAATAAAAAEPQGYDQAPFTYGYFYGDFDADVLLFAGGDAPSFCEGPGEPGSATVRVFERADGTVDLKVDADDQPFFLYRSDLGAPEFLDEVCSGRTEAVAFAEGTGRLKVRISILGDGVVDVYNGMNGTATGSDGQAYKARSWADLLVVDGVPQGDPADFQGLDLNPIGP